MGTHPNAQDRENPSPNVSSPNAASSSNGAPPPPLPPLSPRSIPRSDANSNPTTFIQADTSSFKQVVQLLTGSAETAAKQAAAAASPTPPKSPNPPAGRATGPKKPAFKLYERRGSLKHIKMMSPLIPSFLGSAAAAFSPRKHPEILSPSMLDFPSLFLSPVTPLILDHFNRCSPNPNSSAAAATSEEERAIAEKGFYLHPSPRDADPPRLLPLFPVTSPRLSYSASSP